MSTLFSESEICPPQLPASVKKLKLKLSDACHSAPLVIPSYLIQQIICLEIKASESLGKLLKWLAHLCTNTKVLLPVHSRVAEKLLLAFSSVEELCLRGCIEISVFSAIHPSVRKLCICTEMPVLVDSTSGGPAEIVAWLEEHQKGPQRSQLRRIIYRPLLHPILPFLEVRLTSGFFSPEPLSSDRRLLYDRVQEYEMGLAALEAACGRLGIAFYTDGWEKLAVTKQKMEEGDVLLSARRLETRDILQGTTKFPIQLSLSVSLIPLSA